MGTGKGASGTFQLMDGAKKTGKRYEDPVEYAIIASNEPKAASVPALRHYLSEYHTEYDVANKPKVLMKALERAEAMGWVKRVTGQGMSGTFHLAYPYIPSPKDLWREAYNESDYEVRPRSKSIKYADDSDDEDEEEESEDEYDDTAMKLAWPARQIVTEKFFPRKRKGVHLLSEVSQSKRPRRHRQRLHPRRNSLPRLVSPALEDPKRLTRRSPRKEVVEKKNEYEFVLFKITTYLIIVIVICSL